MHYSQMSRAWAYGKPFNHLWHIHNIRCQFVGSKNKLVKTEYLSCQTNFTTTQYTCQWALICVIDWILVKGFQDIYVQRDSI